MSRVNLLRKEGLNGLHYGRKKNDEQLMIENTYINLESNNMLYNTTLQIERKAERCTFFLERESRYFKELSASVSGAQNFLINRIP